MRAKRNPTGKTIEKGPWLGPDVLDFPAIAVIIVIKNDLASFSFSLFPIAMASTLLLKESPPTRTVTWNRWICPVHDGSFQPGSLARSCTAWVRRDTSKQSAGVL